MFYLLSGRRIESRVSEPHRMDAFTRLPRTQLVLFTAIAIAVAELFANEVFGDDADWSGWVILTALGIALTCVLVFVVVPRIDAGSRRNAVLGFGIGAVVTVLVFWSTLPFALGAAALAAAGPVDDSLEGEAAAPSSAGVLLALLGMLAAFVLCVSGA